MSTISGTFNKGDITNSDSVNEVGSLAENKDKALAYLQNHLPWQMKQVRNAIYAFIYSDKFIGNSAYKEKYTNCVERILLLITLYHRYKYNSEEINEMDIETYSKYFLPESTDVVLLVNELLFLFTSSAVLIDKLIHPHFRHKRLCHVINTRVANRAFARYREKVVYLEQLLDIALSSGYWLIPGENAVIQSILRAYMLLENPFNDNGYSPLKVFVDPNGFSVFGMKDAISLIMRILSTQNNANRLKFTSLKAES